MKKITIFSLAVFLLAYGTSFGQLAEVDMIGKNEVTKLAFMVGHWEGKGWMYGQDRTRKEFDQTEDISFKLDSTLLHIEGIGSANGIKAHHALAIMSFNKEKNHYDFQSYLFDGKKGTFKAELKGDKIYWYPAEHLQYIIWINEKGQWVEKGEYKMGEQWFQFFEMTLDRK